MKTIILFCFMVVFTLNATEQVIVTGRILDIADNPLSDIKVQLQGSSTHTNDKGYYSVKVAPADIYELHIQNEAYYSSIHTFSHFELASSKALKLTIDDISLVKKMQGRTLFAFAGDVMMGRRYSQPNFGHSALITAGQEDKDTKAIVKNVRPYLALADYSAVNLETVIAETQPAVAAPKYVTLHSPPEILTALKWAGVDYLNLGNNHIYDYLDLGLSTSLAYISKSGLAHSGAGLNQQQALLPYRVKLNDRDYSMLSYVGWPGKYRPNQIAEFTKGGAAYGSNENISAAVATEVENNRTVIMQYHGSTEYSSEPTLNTEQRLKSAIDLGADLAIGHHPHVSQGLEIYNGKLIAYSLGNFIFDQFYSATQHSYILYVWMDGDTFYRAEIIPIYLKGYIPTPATGMHRYTGLKRLSALSKKRGSVITPSGGHGVISHNNSKQTNTITQPINLLQGQRVYSLYSNGWSKDLAKVSAVDPTLKYRLGINLLNGSDFESFSTFNTNERGWKLVNGPFKLSEKLAFSGSKSMETELAPGTAASFGMTNFRRVFASNNPLTIQLKIKSEHAAKIEFFWQGRKNSQSLVNALEQGTKHKIDTLDIEAGTDWQTIEVPFHSPHLNYRGFRILLVITNNSEQKNSIYLDDLALIEWQSAFAKPAELLQLNRQSTQASYIGFNKSVEDGATVILTYK
ncbi:MAG: CapA family protein [Alteromonadaceae bacterium]|nr:CapA family protein [Alteromonadaceae bacterium]